MSTATGPAASWDDPLPAGWDASLPEARTTSQTTGQTAAAEAAVAGWDNPLPGYEIGPREASVDDEVDAVTAAMQTRYGDPGWRTAWEHVDATGDNHLRSVQRERQQATDREAGS